MLQRFLSFLFIVSALTPSAFLESRELSGLVVDANGDPVGEIEVMWSSTDLDERVSSVISDEHGWFHLANIPESEGYLLLHGQLGVGRVFVEADHSGVLPVIRYPVLTEVILLHDNDRHFYDNFPLEMEAFIAAWRARTPNVFLINTGDMLVRHRHRWREVNSVDYYERMGRSLAESMNRLAYDFAVLGNHENAWIEDATRSVLELLEFPLLAANIFIETDRYIVPLPYIHLFTRNGLKLTFLGLTVGQGEGLQVTDPQESVDHYRYLRDEADFFALATHVGVQMDRQLAAQNDFVDLIIGGHSHTLLPRGELVNGVLITQAGGNPHVDGGFMDEERAMGMGVIQLLFSNGRLVERSARVHFITGRIDRNH